MKGIIKVFSLFCLLALSSHFGFGKYFQSDDFVNDWLFEQLECEVVELPSYLFMNPETLEEDIVYTVEIRLRNPSEKVKLIWFKNNEEITGWPSCECHFRDVINFAAEYDGGILRIENVEDYKGVMFCNWLKSLAPQQEFTIFILSNDQEKIKGAFKLIGTNVYNNVSKATSDLNYDGDVIVISI